jgi:spoIIIJ-associated protein
VTSKATLVETEGDSIDEAIAAALAELQLPRERVQIEIIQDVRRGVLGFGAQPAKVRASERIEPLDGAREPEMFGADLPPASSGAAILRRVLALMAIPASVDVATDEESAQTWLRISSQAGGLLIGRHGQTLEAIEYLVNRIAGPQDDRVPRYLVDVEGYRARRTDELREAARKLAERARTSGRTQEMSPLSSRERRVVHLALKNDESVTTRSSGDGPFRHVVIEPLRSPSRR